MYTILVRRKHVDDLIRKKEFVGTDLLDCSVYCKASSFDDAKRYCNILKEKAKRNNVEVYIVPVPRAYSEDDDPDIIVTFYSYILTIEDILYTTPQIEQKETLFIMTSPLSAYKNKLVMRANGEKLGTVIFTDETSTFQCIRNEPIRKFGIKLRNLLIKENIVLELLEFKFRYDGPVDHYCLMLYTDRDPEEAKNICLDYLRRIKK